MKITARWMVTGALMLLLSLFTACEFEGLQFGPDDDANDIEIKPEIEVMKQSGDTGGTYVSNENVKRGAWVCVEAKNDSFGGDWETMQIPDGASIVVNQGSNTWEVIVENWYPSQISFRVPPIPGLTAGGAFIKVITKGGESEPFYFTIKSGFSTTQASGFSASNVSAGKVELQTITNESFSFYRIKSNDLYKYNSMIRIFSVYSVGYSAPYYRYCDDATYIPSSSDYSLQNNTSYFYFISIHNSDGDGDWVPTSVTTSW